MSPLVDQVRHAVAFGADIRFLAASPAVAALGPDVLARATGLYAAHLAAVAPFATGPLPAARVEPHTNVLTVLRRLGFALPDPSLAAAPSPGPLRPSPVRVAPIVPTAPPSLGGASQLPPVTPESARWADACAKAAIAAVERIRSDVTAKARLADLAAAYGVRPSTDDPYLGLSEILAVPLHAAYWQHPHAGLSQAVECLAQQPHQSASRALESHLRWLATWGDDARHPSPWWPVLHLWNRRSLAHPRAGRRAAVAGRADRGRKAGARPGPPVDAVADGRQPREPRRQRRLGGVRPPLRRDHAGGPRSDSRARQRRLWKPTGDALPAGAGRFPVMVTPPTEPRPQRDRGTSGGGWPRGQRCSGGRATTGGVIGCHDDECRGERPCEASS